MSGFNLKFFKAQEDYVNAVFSGKYKYLLYGGDINSGKSVVNIGCAILLSKVYPGSKWIVIRKDLPTLKKTSIPTFGKICPPNFIKDWNRSEHRAIFTNGSELHFMAESIDTDPSLNRFLGLEVNGFILEQVEELTEKLFNICISRIGRWKGLDRKPPMVIMMNCNPNNGWSKVKFYDPWVRNELKPPFYFQEANIFDNPHVTEEELENLKNLPPELYKRYLERSWEGIDSPNQLVYWTDLEKCIDPKESTDKTKYLGVDVGRFGPDPTLLCLMEGPNVIEFKAFDKTTIPQTERAVISYIEQYNIHPKNVVVDAVGLGAGVVDNLREKNIRVQSFVGGRKVKFTTKTKFSFANERAVASWLAAEEIKRGKVGSLTDDRFKSDCTAVTYKIRSDREILIDPKEEIKKKIGRSTDSWDAYYMARWPIHKMRIRPQPIIAVTK